MMLSDYISIGKKMDAFLLPLPPSRQGWTLNDAPLPAQLSDEVHFKSYIKDVDGNRYLIDQPPVEDIELRRVIDGGRWLRLHIYTGQGQVQCVTSVQNVQGAGLLGYWIELPANTAFHYVQRREFVRVTTWDKVTVQVYSPETKEFVCNMTGQAHNISGNGLRFSSPKALMPGTQHGIILHTEKEDFRLWGEIVYCHKNPNKRAPAREQFISAMHLINTPRDVERQLVKYCFELEREREARRNYPK